jgi:hypothetical protein
LYQKEIKMSGNTILDSVSKPETQVLSKLVDALSREVDDDNVKRLLQGLKGTVSRDF